MITRRTPIMGNGRGKRRCSRASKRPPLPIKSSLRAPDSGPFTFRSEISQGIACRRVGNLSIDQREKSARLAKRASLVVDGDFLGADGAVEHALAGQDLERVLPAEPGLAADRRGELAGHDLHGELEIARREVGE